MERNILKVLCDLVNIQSYGAIDKNHQIIKYLMRSFCDCKEIALIESEDESAHLLVGINTPLSDVKDCILLSGHIDTVVPSSNHQPKAHITGDKIVGLGGADMKAFSATIIANLEQLKRSKIPIILALTTDEERDFFGIGTLTNAMKERSISPSLVIVGEPTSSKFSFANQGNSIFVSKMHGVPCHTSTPELGVNAVYLSAKMASEVERIASAYSKDATVAVTKIQGGSAPNIVPEFCSMHFSVRTYSKSTLEAVTKEFEKAHDEIAKKAPGSKLSNMFSIPPFERRENLFLTSYANKHNIEITESKFASEAGDIQDAFPDAEITLFGAGDPSKIHRAGEEVEIKELFNYSLSLLELIENYSSFKKEIRNERKF